MKKRVLSLILALVMIFSLVQVTALADDETATTPSYVTYDGNYAIVNLQGNGANAQIYNTTGEWHKDKDAEGNAITTYPMTLLDGFSPADYLSRGFLQSGAYAEGLYILNKKGVDAAKNTKNGYIYAANGTPFMFKTEIGAKNGIILGSQANKNVEYTVNLNLPKYYKKLSFVEAGTGDGCANQPIVIKVKYKGEDEVQLASYKTTKYLQTGGKIPASIVTAEGNVNVVGVSSIDCFDNDNTRLSFAQLNLQGYNIKNSTTPFGKSYFPGAIEVALDPSKEVEYVTFKQAAIHGSTAILAMTAIKGTDEEIVADALAKLPANVTTITAENYANYVSPLAVIDEKVADGYSLSASDLAKVNAVKDAIEYYANQYQIIDMTEVANGTTYGTLEADGKFPNWTTAAAPAYLSVYAEPNRAAVVLNRTAFNGFKDETTGLIYADDGVPFNFRTEEDTLNTINLGGSATTEINEADVSVSGNFKSIDVVLLSTGAVSKYGNSTATEVPDYEDDRTFSAEVHYTDGTVEYSDLHGRFQGWGSNTTINFTPGTGYAVPKSQFSKFAKNRTCLRITSANGVESYWGTPVPTYSIETDPAKTVAKVVFKSDTTKRCMISILAMTGVKASPEEVFAAKIKNIPEANTITEANYKTYRSLYIDIEEDILAGFTVPEDYKAAYDAFKEVMDDFINQEGTPTISVGSVKGKAGDEVSVDVVLSNNPGVLLISFDVCYDEEVMSLTGFDLKDKLMADNETNPTIGTSSHTISLGNPGEDADVIGDGVLATLTFTLHEDVAVTDIAVQPTLKLNAAYNNNKDELVFGVADGSTRTAWLGHTYYYDSEGRFLAFAKHAGKYANGKEIEKFGIRFDGFDFETTYADGNNVFAIEVQDLDTEPTGVTAFASYK